MILLDPEDAEAYRIPDESHRVTDAELPADAAVVGVHGLSANAETEGDLLVAEALGDESKDLSFAGGETMVPVVTAAEILFRNGGDDTEKLPGGHRTKEALSRRRRANGVDEMSGAILLADEGGYPL